MSTWRYYRKLWLETNAKLKRTECLSDNWRRLFFNQKALTDRWQRLARHYEMETDKWRDEALRQREIVRQFLYYRDQEVKDDATQ